MIKKIFNVGVLPSLITILNTFFGFLAIIHAVAGDFVAASWFIAMAALFDGFDGKVARMVKKSSEFGVEFDSLADVVSFGVSPSVVLYLCYFTEWGFVGILISFLPLLMGGIRLARFNVELTGFDKKSFKGLPIPACAMALVSFIIFEKEIFGAFAHSEIMAGLIVFLSILMISNLKYDTMPKFSLKRDKKNFLKLSIFVITLGFFLVFRGKALFPIMMVLVFTGFMKLFFDPVRLVEKDDGDDGLEDDDLEDDEVSEVSAPNVKI